MEVDYGKYHYVGWPKDVLTSLSISIGLYLRYYRYVKIGITGNPERRFREHLNPNCNPNCNIKWQRMVVKYKTNSINHANYIEDYFINKKRSKLRNKWIGYSYMSEQGPYFVYILLSGKRKK